MAARTPVRPAAAGLKPTALASPFFVVDDPAPETEVPALPGLPRLPAHWNLPLITLLGPASALKVLQSLEMSPDDWMLKAPWLSLRAGSETLSQRLVVAEHRKRRRELTM
jgi:hypothetical protein